MPEVLRNGASQQLGSKRVLLAAEYLGLGSGDLKFAAWTASMPTVPFRQATHIDRRKTVTGQLSDSPILGLQMQERDLTFFWKDRTYQRIWEGSALLGPANLYPLLSALQVTRSYDQLHHKTTHFVSVPPFRLPPPNCCASAYDPLPASIDRSQIGRMQEHIRLCCPWHLPRTCAIEFRGKRT